PAKAAFWACCKTLLLYFFFSSRRRHTRSDRDWSSDVCSSDLDEVQRDLGDYAKTLHFVGSKHGDLGQLRRGRIRVHVGIADEQRSEERRVGKECRSGGSGF